MPVEVCWKVSNCLLAPLGLLFVVAQLLGGGVNLSAPTLPWRQTQCRKVRTFRRRQRRLFKGRASLAQARACSARKRNHHVLEASLLRGGKVSQRSGVPVSAGCIEERDTHLNQIFRLTWNANLSPIPCRVTAVSAILRSRTNPRMSTTSTHSAARSLRGGWATCPRGDSMSTNVRLPGKESVSESVQPAYAIRVHAWVFLPVCVQ